MQTSSSILLCHSRTRINQRLDGLKPAHPLKNRGRSESLASMTSSKFLENHSPQHLKRPWPLATIHIFPVVVPSSNRNGYTVFPRPYFDQSLIVTPASFYEAPFERRPADTALRSHRSTNRSICQSNAIPTLTSSSAIF